MNIKKLRKNRPVISLFVAGKTIKSITALKNLKFICNEVLKGMYKLEVIDILKNPKLARENQVLAIPTLVLRMPLPRRNIIGDLSNRELMLAELNYSVKGKKVFLSI